VRRLLLLIPLLLAIACSDDDDRDHCPDPDDPKVRYAEDSDRDPAVCERIRFTCVEGATPFSNECGCGCLLP
jgi:hypothetical protein